ncbi:MAG TPA: Yip1 family protein [Allosphingosinicella sp.]|jgi:hypothetical protein
MATNPTGESRVPLVQRAKNILTTPKTEWPVIDSEPDSIGGIYKNYVVILAAIPPVCLLIGMFTFGGRFLPMNYLIAQAVIGYLVALASVYILALIIEALAPSFGGTKDRVKAFKVAAYASTAAWVVGIFYLLPQLLILGLVGALYSLYLLYLGLPVLMKTPADKSVVYTVAIIVAAIVINLVLGAITAQILFSMVTPTAILPAAYPG